MKSFLRAALAFGFCSVLASGAEAVDLEDFLPGIVEGAQTQFSAEVRGDVPGPDILVPGTPTGTFDPTAAVQNLNNAAFLQFQNRPVGSSVAAFTFSFDAQRNVFERSLEGLGPLLSERAQTTGKGKFNVAFAYAYVDFDQFEGDDLDSLPVNLSGTSTGSIGSTTFQGSGVDLTFDNVQLTGANPTFDFSIPMSGSIDETIPGASVSGSGPSGDYQLSISVPQARLDADIRTQLFTLFANYGVADTVDLALVLPLVDNTIEARVVTTPMTMMPPKQRERDFGLGDLILRAKWFALETELVDFGVRGDLYVPTGDEDELRGYGNAAFQAVLIASKAFGRVAPYLNTGFFFVTDDKDLHQFRYSVGADVRIVDRLSVVAEAVGSQDLYEDDIGDTQISGAFGVKVNPWRRLVISANALVRFNDQGLRADVVPSGGIEYTF